MSRIAFEALPDSARLWIFAADRALTSPEREALGSSVEMGLAEWNAHGSPVTWAYRLEREQFLLIGVDESTTALSGCSIDGAIRQIRALEERLGLSLLDNARVFYREGDSIRGVARSEFRALAEAGRVDANTVVFNNVIGTLGDLRAGLWEVPAHRSWHGTAFPIRT